MEHVRISMLTKTGGTMIRYIKESELVSYENRHILKIEYVNEETYNRINYPSRNKIQKFLKETK